MNRYEISINQFADFSKATDNAKRRIISQQLEPNPFLVPWYQKTKSSLRKSFEQKGDLAPIYEGIQFLRQKKVTSQRQVTDRRVSIEALERFIAMKMPSILSDVDYEVIKPKKRTTTISDVEVIVAPDIVINGNIKGKDVLGGVKIHISKNKPFDLHQSKIVATTIHTYLLNEVAKDGVEVMPDLCLCLDIFGERIVSADNQNKELLKEIDNLCFEIKELYDKG